MSNGLKNRFGYVSKCGGIPMYPEEFNVNMERPESVTDEDIKKWDESFERFMEKMEQYFD